MSFHLLLEIIGLPELQAAGSQGGWRGKWAKGRAWADKVKWLAHSSRPKKPLQRARVICTRYSSAEPDHDNLVASFKVTIDALTRMGFWPDDSPQHLEVAYQWAAAKRGKGWVSVEIVEA
jgi:Holliday junction resolvase RusA-like endonuclease